MSLADELEAENQVDQVTRCKICHWLTQVSEKDIQSYDQWLRAGRDKSKLYRACTRIEPPVPGAYSTFSRHIRECADVPAG